MLTEYMVCTVDLVTLTRPLPPTRQPTRDDVTSYSERAVHCWLSVRENSESAKLQYSVFDELGTCGSEVRYL